MTPPLLLIRPALAEFGQRVREARLAATLTQRQLAHLARVNRSYMQDVEYGKNVSLATIVLLADALGCEVVDLFEKRRQMGAPRKTGTQTCRTRSLVQGPRTTQVEPSFTLIG